VLERGRRGQVSTRGINWLIVRTGDLTSAFILRPAESWLRVHFRTGMQSCDRSRAVHNDENLEQIVEQLWNRIRNRVENRVTANS
jgi:hypothetical protein